MVAATAFVLLLAGIGAVCFPFELRATDGLNTRTVAAGKAYFGSATDNPELTDTAYVAGLSNTADFGQITPGNSMKVCRTLVLCKSKLIKNSGTLSSHLEVLLRTPTAMLSLA